MLPIKDYLVSDKEKEKMNGLYKGLSFCKSLEESGIKYEVLLKHDEVLGCNQSIEYYERFKEYLAFDYSVCKHLLVHERKGDKRTFLIITDSLKKVDLNSVREELDTKKLEFVSDEEMKNLINTTPGNVSLFNMIYDVEKKVNLIIDREILEREVLTFHPLYNGMSMFIKTDECLKFLKLINRNIHILEIKEKDINYQKSLVC